MTRLIDADALKKALHNFFNGLVIKNHDKIDEDIYAYIDNAPTVAEDYDTGYQDGLEDGLNDIRPKGEWIRKGDSKWHCSECGAVPEFGGTTNTDKFDVTMSNKYCRLCGADMRKGGAE